ncbi:hypothetical protein [Gluconobacter oxydans]|uniref:hypothetical protein n=1 Tax=Gluconobacter oxydans TaxID=442 RepID=UPI0002E09F0F|nr:hypothetical protein [Gluconobacter oxydans]
MSGRTDAERLEWLDGVGDFSVTSHANEYCFLHLDRCGVKEMFSGDNIAEAIDAAMDAEEQE